MIEFDSRRTENGTLVIRLSGKLDESAANYLFHCVEGEINDGNTNVVINCADLGYISSFGLASLVRARNKILKNGGKVCMAEVQSVISELLNVVNFDRIFDIYPLERDAIWELETK